MPGGIIGTSYWADLEKHEKEYLLQRAPLDELNEIRDVIQASRNNIHGCVALFGDGYARDINNAIWKFFPETKEFRKVED